MGQPPQDDFNEPSTKTGLERAAEYGVDVTLLRSNLRLSPTERVRRLQQFVASVRAIQAEAEAWRKRKSSSS
ncbi:MAG: hypothetical protein M3220_21840 [Chloroflexota bacterium]|nr:hypothetical protein [Chloroflexota bacterium]